MTRAKTAPRVDLAALVKGDRVKATVRERETAATLADARAKLAAIDAPGGGA